MAGSSARAGLTDTLLGVGATVVGTDARLRLAGALGAAAGGCQLPLMREIRFALRADGRLEQGEFVFDLAAASGAADAATLELELALAPAEQSADQPWRPALGYRPPSALAASGSRGRLDFSLADGALLLFRFDPAGRLFAEDGAQLDYGPRALALLEILARPPAARPLPIEPGDTDLPGSLALLGQVLAAGERLRERLAGYRRVALVQPAAWRVRLLGGRLRAWAAADGALAAPGEAVTQRVVLDMRPAGDGGLSLAVDHARFVRDTTSRRRMLAALAVFVRAEREAYRHRRGERPLQPLVDRLFPNGYEPADAPPDCRPPRVFGPDRGARARAAAALCEVAKLLAEESAAERAVVLRIDHETSLLHLPADAHGRWLLALVRLHRERAGVFAADGLALLDGQMVIDDRRPDAGRWRRSVRPCLERALGSVHRFQAMIR